MKKRQLKKLVTHYSRNDHYRAIKQARTRGSKRLQRRDRAFRRIGRPNAAAMKLLKMAREDGHPEQQEARNAIGWLMHNRPEARATVKRAYRHIMVEEAAIEARRITRSVRAAAKIANGEADLEAVMQAAEEALGEWGEAARRLRP